ncbi:MAG TPA: hypothetical protein HA254_06310 [Candidatus Diapherotrites archaeon]|uniref:Class III signal peptide-containing protein n=1 Tax=Candidatus Iainarchaeum sp. TaxID=3101447 RepID=A0A7J4IXX5_9ARCH|nr:hypothetical protein [Candidatus Diapherotrites archaeon]
MKGQASIEIIFLIGLTLLLSFMLVSRVFAVQDSVFTQATMRQELISTIDKFDKKYDVNVINSKECGSEIRVDIEIKPLPSPDEQSEIKDSLIGGAAKVRSSAKTFDIRFNEPAIIGTSC